MLLLIIHILSCMLRMPITDFRPSYNYSSGLAAIKHRYHHHCHHRYHHHYPHRYHRRYRHRYHLATTAAIAAIITIIVTITIAIAITTTTAATAM